MEYQLTTVMITMVSLTMGITQVYKSLIPKVSYEKFFFIALSKATPLVALIIGVSLSFLYDGGFNYEALESGLVVGLTAAGVYSGGKTILNKKEVV